VARSFVDADMAMATPGVVAEAPDPARFRKAMGHFATGVTVVTLATPDGPYGMTISSFTSLSLDPMLVLVCLSRGSRGLELLDAVGAFTVNVLSDSQEHISRWFADRNRPAGRDAFGDLPYSYGSNGCPRLIGTAAAFDCLVYETHGGGDHRIVVGQVIAFDMRSDLEPLIFHRGRYAHALAGELNAA
jgi:flavin reductase (DIM6/NTAB) family NADH-FMN oxidoreductase RutF